MRAKKICNRGKLHMRIIKAPVQKEHAILRKGLRLVFQAAAEDAMPRNRNVGSLRIKIENQTDRRKAG